MVLRRFEKYHGRHTTNEHHVSIYVVIHVPPEVQVHCFKQCVYDDILMVLEHNGHALSSVPKYLC